MSVRNSKPMVSAVCLVVGLAGTAGIAAAAGSGARSSGPDAVYSYLVAGNPMENASAEVGVVHTGNGKTHVTLHVTGVNADDGRVFGAHVHSSDCAATFANNPHYDHTNPSSTDIQEREVWLDFTIDEFGEGHSKNSKPWNLDESVPRSVVIHRNPTNSITGAAGDRLVCIDLDGVH